MLICSHVGPRPFPREGNNGLAKIHWLNFKIFFSRTIGPISTILAQSILRWKGIQFCSITWASPLPRGYNCKTTKIHWRILKIFFSRTSVLLSTKLGTKHVWVTGSQLWSNNGPVLFQGGDYFEMIKNTLTNLKYPLFQNQRAYFNASLGEGDLCLFK